MVDVDGDGQIIPIEYGGNDIYRPGGAPMYGFTAGYFLKRGLNTDDLTSVYPGNTEPDFYLEWHGVDGADSDLGWGDDRDIDEDDDGTWFDRIVGIPGIPSMRSNQVPSPSSSSASSSPKPSVEEAPSTPCHSK